MLLHMHISNIILIDDLSIDFFDGLNILTGETGAGKSIIIGSLGIGLGGKFPRDILRDEDKDGVVELLFSVESDGLKKKLGELNIDAGDGELLISRRLVANGRSVNRINDVVVTTAKLKEVTALLLDLHAQHEQQTLLKVSKHLEIIDSFGGEAISVLKAEVSRLYREYRDIKEELEGSAMDEIEKNKRRDFLEYQISEINAAKLVAGEDEALEILYKKLKNAKELLTLSGEIYELTGYDFGRSGAGEMIGRALENMRRVAELDEDAENLKAALTDIDSILNDFNSELSAYMKSMDIDEETLHETELRLDLINSLKAKYGKSIPDILENLGRLEEEYKKLEDYDEYINALEGKLRDVEAKLGESSDKLTLCRKNFAVKLCGLVKETLTELNFPAVEFDMEWKKLADFSTNGNDQACFVISTNVGEPIRPLYEVASGGELSRVMLAIKATFAGEDDTPTLIFDEIDVGISGRTAQKVAEKLSVISKSHQVICITHLPQIAAMADTHFCIEKNVENNKTFTNIRKLDKEEEIREISRLLGGASITEATLASAKEMKDLADKAKLN